MRPYSLDLRERILAAVDHHEGSIRWIARIFRVSTSFIVRLLQHLSPLGWEHINLTGDYVWRQDRKVRAGKFRPLRPLPQP